MRYGPPRAIALAATFMITFALSVPALARVCHPDPQGTKTLLVHGDVVGYTVRGGLVHVAVSGRTACRTLAWNVLAAQRRRVVFAGRGACTNSPLGAAVRVPEIARAVVSVSDGPFRALVSTDSVRIYRNGALVRQFHRVRTAAAQKAVLRGTKLLVLVRGSDAADQPDRLEAYDLHGATVRSWALPDQATTLDVAKGIVVFSAAHGGAYALRLRDGMMTLLSPNWYGDVPQIDRLGVVYEDGMFERDRRAHRVPVKFVPLPAVADDFARTYHTFTTSGPITGLAMDGPNVAVSYRGAASESKCDQVLIWDALWHDVAQPTMDGGLSCPQHQRAGHIRSVTVGNIEARWVVSSGHTSRLISASSRNCVQHLLATANASAGSRLQNLAGDRRWFSFVTTHRDGTATLTLTDVNATTEPKELTLPKVPLAVSLDNGTIAVLESPARVNVLARNGAAGGVFDTIPLDSIALRGDTLVGLTKRATLAVYDANTGALRHEWDLPHQASGAIGYHFGIALVSAGNTAYAVRVSDGRIARIAEGRGRVSARIDDAGVAYASNLGGRGYAGFIRMSTVEQELAGR